MCNIKPKALVFPVFQLKLHREQEVPDFHLARALLLGGDFCRWLAKFGCAAAILVVYVLPDSAREKNFVESHGGSPGGARWVPEVRPNWKICSNYLESAGKVEHFGMAACVPCIWPDV